MFSFEHACYISQMGWSVVEPRLHYAQYDLITLKVLFYRCWGALTLSFHGKTERLCVTLTPTHNVPSQPSSCPFSAPPRFRFARHRYPQCVPHQKPLELVHHHHPLFVMLPLLLSPRTYELPTPVLCFPAIDNIHSHSAGFSLCFQASSTLPSSSW